MKIWMKLPGEVLYLFNGGNVDLRNTSPERPVEVDDKLGKKLLLDGIVFEVKDAPKVDPVIVDPIVEPDNWDELTWNKKKAFAIDNGYDGVSYKTLDLNSWYKGFLKKNEV